MKDEIERRLTAIERSLARIERALRPQMQQAGLEDTVKIWGEMQSAQLANSYDLRRSMQKRPRPKPRPLMEGS